MSLQYQLSERHQDILRKTIKHYIATAEPVGSKTLLEEYNFRLSSATIRNAMGWLEKIGLLYQPHTSAGRIPSDSGYRIYVDQLITPDENLGRKIETLLTKQLKIERWSFEAILQRAAQILATLSGYIALVTVPQNPTNRVKHLQLIQISPQQVMLIIVTDNYQTQSVLINAPKSFSETNSSSHFFEEELQILSNFLNNKLQGHSLAELTKLNWQEIDQDFQHYAEFLCLLIQELSRQSQSYTVTPIMISGVSEVLRQPEFSQLQQLQMLLHLLEQKQEQLFPLIFELPEPEINPKRVTIKIGAENPLKPMQNCTLVSAHYCQDKIPVGSVSIIGPTRMLYENSIALVEAAADYLSETLTEV